MLPLFVWENNEYARGSCWRELMEIINTGSKQILFSFEEISYTFIICICVGVCLLLLYIYCIIYIIYQFHLYKNLSDLLVYTHVFLVSFVYTVNWTCTIKMVWFKLNFWRIYFLSFKLNKLRKHLTTISFWIIWIWTRISEDVSSKHIFYSFQF